MPAMFLGCNEFSFGGLSVMALANDVNEVDNIVFLLPLLENLILHLTFDAIVYLLHYNLNIF